MLPTGDWGLGECPPLTIRAPLARKLLDQFLSQALKNVIQMLQCGQQKYQKILSQMWWLMLVIPAVGRLTQGYCWAWVYPKFPGSSSYRVKISLQTKKKTICGNYEMMTNSFSSFLYVSMLFNFISFKLSKIYMDIICIPTSYIQHTYPVDQKSDVTTHVILQAHLKSPVY